jgi:hypothetical protein
MGANAAMPGAGSLKGSEFLLFSDWKQLGDRPDLGLYEQINKARDIWIKTRVILEDTPTTKAKYTDKIEKCRDDLVKIMKEYHDFSSIKGSDNWQNDLWIRISDVFYELYHIQHLENLIETDIQERFGVPG